MGKPFPFPKAIRILKEKSMKITKTSVDELNLVVEIAIEKQDYEPSVNETLKDYRKKANLPGFRKGMVPTGLIKKMYGKAAIADEVNKLLSRELTKYITDQNLNILGEPLPALSQPSIVDFDNATEFKFAFDLGLSPEITIAFDKIKKLPFYEIIVDDQLIDNQIEGYTNRFGENIAADVVGKKETTTGDFIQVDSEGNSIEGGISSSNVQMSVQLIKDKSVQKLFIGAKVGDVLKFNPKTALQNDHEVAHLLKVKDDEIDSVSGDFSFTINTINTFIPAQLDESLFKKIYGEESEVKTIAELREKIRTELESNLIYSSNYRFSIDAKEAFVKQVSMKLPEDFLKRWLVETNENVTKEQIEEEFDHFKKDLEWTLIKSKLGKDHEIRIDESDITSMAKEMAKMQFQQYGMSNVPDEYLDNYANSILQNKEQRQKMAEKKVEDKVLELIKDKVTITNKKISQKEFDDLFEK
jgi:trigger factor